MSTIGTAAPARFITIDPGLQASGWALWERGRLQAVGLLRAPRSSRGLSDRSEEQVEVLRRFKHLTHCPPGTVVVSEVMFHRHFKGNKVDPNDLIRLNYLAGRLSDFGVEATAWKGSVPRDVEQAHTKHVLDARELALVERVVPASLRKEAWSAVGLGLSLLERAHQRLGWGVWA